MAVWISVSTEAIDNNDANRRQPQDNVRRPTRGIQVKPDTYACLRVITATGEDLPFLDSSSAYHPDGIGLSTHYYNFMIQSVQDQRAEKSQIVETFGEDYIYFFGERPRFLNVTGVVVNSKDFNWKNEFWSNYESRLRGTRLVEQNARLYFYFDDVVVEGFMMGAGATYTSDSPYLLPIQFQLFVTNYVELSTVGSVYFQEAEAEADMDFTDTSQQPGQSRGLPPPTTEAQQQAAQQAANMGAEGGLNSFLAQANKFYSNASFSIQSTLENIRNAFFGRSLVVPQGLGASVLQSPIENQAKFNAAPTNVPIHEMGDEYVNRSPTAAVYDQNEINRINQELAMRTPEELEKKAKAELEKLGIDTSRREVSYALLGRGAFAATQTMGSHAIVQAGGQLPPI
jgi:hypothetical protein